MKQKRFKSSITIPLALSVYLAVMAYYGRGMLIAGDAIKYYGIIACTIAILIALHFSLKKKEKLRAKREEEIYTTYEKEDEALNSDSSTSSDKKNVNP